MLEPIYFPQQILDDPLDGPTESFIAASEQKIEAFQDDWDQHRIEQYVAADFRCVIAVLRWIKETQLCPNGRFLEWGCGFGVVSSLASRDGWDAVGIESEPVLIQQARELIAANDVSVDLFEGNFLPDGAEDYSDNPMHPSLNHTADPVYDAIGLDLDDFGIIYSYPWPGENLFHETVVERFGGESAIHLQFAGPRDVRVFRNSPRRSSGGRRAARCR